MSALQQFKLPDVGEGLTEAEIIRWHVAPGDLVDINDLLVEIETAKSVVELTSPFAGPVIAIHVAEGDTVSVGTPLITIGEPSAAAVGTASTPAQPSDAAVTPSETTAQDEHREVLVGYGPTPTAVTRRPRRANAPGSFPEPASATPTAPADTASVQFVKGVAPITTPPVRLLAKSLGLDLSTVRGTGPEGRVTRQDVQQHTTQPPPSTAPTDGDPLRTPIKGVRKHTAQAMVTSAFTAPHVTEWLTVDVTRTLKLMDRLRKDREFTSVRLTLLVLIMRATLVAIARNPSINSRWDGEAGEIVQFRDVNLGIAAATPRGLLVPNIKQAQSLSTIDLAKALQTVVNAARSGALAPEAMRGGTFTITNIGGFGVDGGTPILNPGEAAILCVGRVRRMPWEHKARVRLRDTLTLSMSFDHRLVDGELGSMVLADIATLLEHPELALAL